MALTALTHYSAGRYERVMASPGDCEWVTPGRDPALPECEEARQVGASARAVVPGCEVGIRGRPPAPGVDGGHAIAAHLPRGQISREEGQEEHDDEQADAALDEGDDLTLDVRRRGEADRAEGRTAREQCLDGIRRRVRAPVHRPEAHRHQRVPRVDRRELGHRPVPEQAAVHALLRRALGDEEVEGRPREQGREPRDHVVPGPVQEDGDDDGPEEQGDAREPEDEDDGVREGVGCHAWSRPPG
jgi:hypothetical protein